MPREDTPASSITGRRAELSADVGPLTNIGHDLLCADATGIDEELTAPQTQCSCPNPWPNLARITVRFRGRFAYIDGVLPDETTLPLMRLRYNGSASRWGFAIALASNGKYEDSMLPTGDFTGSPDTALDTACGLYLADPATTPPTN